jgi:plasmid stability protein
MTQITLRNLDSEVEKEIRRRANASGKSLSKVIREMLTEVTSPGEKRKTLAPARSLAKLAGGWTEKEAAEFLESIKSCEQVDEEIWQ